MSQSDPARSTRRRAIASIALIGLVAATLLAGVDRLTQGRIAAERERHAQAALLALLPLNSFDNLPRQEAISIEPGPYGLPLLVYPARLGNELTALIADVTTPAGYSGDIRLLVAVDPAGVVIGVSVLEHRETPGLGDLIERRKSDWIEQFSGRSLDDPPNEGWAASRRGGEFDTLTSATLTSQAVVRAVRDSLEALSELDHPPSPHSRSGWYLPDHGLTGCGMRQGASPELSIAHCAGTKPEGLPYDRTNPAGPQATAPAVFARAVHPIRP